VTETSKPSKSLTVLIGWLVTAVAFVLGVILMIAEAMFDQGNPYAGLITYVLLPMAIGFGLFLVMLGTLLDWRQRKKHHDEHRPLPIVDLNSARTRRIFLIVALGVTAFFTVSAVGTYKAFLYTESTEFCGTVCHEVMKPEYVAYKHSPHARVDCVECHIGSGAGWYVKSKLSGLRQVYRTVTRSYELPIEVPVRNLRPARDTCEQCHWPEKFSDSIERVEWHYWFDKNNTPSRYHMLMKIGGVNPRTGNPQGIHWHVSAADTIRYWPRDRQRLDIPWIEVEHADGSKTVYKTLDWEGPAPPEGELREMDCIDCHNRPAHIYKPPSALVNTALAAGRLDHRLPFLKRNSVEILSLDYGSLDEARARIAEEVRRRYPVGSEGSVTEVRQDELIAALTEFYELNHFPEQGVSWKTYPNHIGHLVFPGCFRCHDDKHASDSGEVISKGCDDCHGIVYQAWGDAAYEPVQYRTQPFRHPGGQGDMHEQGLCSDCHAADASYPGHSARTAPRRPAPAEPVTESSAADAGASR